MEDIRERLTNRRAEVLQRLGDIGSAPKQNTRGWEERPHLLQELVTIEQTLAQIAATEAQAKATAAQVAATDAAERTRTAQDDAAFWFRRFMVSLQLANGAAFVAAVTGVLQADDLPRAAAVAASPTAWFALGILGSGLLPLVLWLERQPWGSIVRWVSRAALVLGAAISILAFSAGLVEVTRTLGSYVKPQTGKEAPAPPADKAGQQKAG